MLKLKVRLEKTQIDVFGKTTLFFRPIPTDEQLVNLESSLCVVAPSPVCLTDFLMGEFYSIDFALVKE